MLMRLLTKYRRFVEISDSDGGLVGRSYFLFGRERFNDDGTVYMRWPWQLKLPNAFIKNWYGSDAHKLHSHTNWTISIVLRGWIIEERASGRGDFKTVILNPGRVVFRRFHQFHRYVIPPSVKSTGGAWTIFIRGRWKYRQYFMCKPGTDICSHHDYIKDALKWTPYEHEKKT